MVLLPGAPDRRQDSALTIPYNFLRSGGWHRRPLERGCGPDDPAIQDGCLKIPRDALIPLEKLTSYLLVSREWDDKSKFLAQAGFNLQNPHLLLAAIRELAAAVEAVEDGANEYGEFLRAEGELLGPKGQTLAAVTIWLRSKRDDRIRFVTLKPRKEKKT
jgi:hypothetical protein